MFRKLSVREREFLEALHLEGRLNSLPDDLEQVRVEFRRCGKTASKGKEYLPPAFTIAIVEYIEPPDNPQQESEVIQRIGVAMRDFRDREKSTTGENLALVRAFRDMPIGRDASAASRQPEIATG